MSYGHPCGPTLPRARIALTLRACRGGMNKELTCVSILFTQGSLKATLVRVVLPFGTVHVSGCRVATGVTLARVRVECLWVCAA